MINRLLVVTTAAFVMASAFGATSIKSTERKLYTASNSTEAILEFNGIVQYESARTPVEKTMRNQIEAQLDHIIGPMSEAQYTAVPKGDHIVTDIKIVKKDKTTLTISYKYKGTIVLQNGPKDTYTILLPVNPKTIYAAAMVGDENPCTDEHYQTEGDFWYFWSPSRPGCKLKEGKDYNIVNAKIQRIVNSKLSYPEYQNLPDEKGNITIHVLFGMDDPTLSRNPLSSTDINAVNYRTFRNYLLKNGYKATTWTDNQVNAIAKTLDGAAPFVETIQKEKIVYRFFYAPTGIDEEALGFHWFYKDALENASIVMYEGHSGLGGHLDLDSIEQNLGETIKFSKRYQIYFFDSCTSYKYYNTAYFERKINAKDLKGTKKLDIFTNGLSTAFDAMPAASAALDMALEKALNLAQTGNGFVSYQTLAKQIDSDNLFGVNGDEDNVTPSKIK
ncbi:MAG: hypothetical protein H7281_08775 [Bacteriovorax sp.]|nr:hypothetical protein [Bacteriovorax sp.]